ncbi:KH domain-containing protein [Candidatus Nanohalobium constans]|uniref:Ribosomal RNA assembly protein n=1 Tax=Candidatus Nanohalobium constans TaxID=2565781 RepID=A0A5Q0UJ42_9ARCH|nr:KH domain-containing protein [Candidatus Nanohalobium constans]QGA80849.1 ribosomal RNA assembly protein [Candidatus Nanohalobium constans]
MKKVKIPEKRVGVLIGEGGETKEEFEDLTDTELTITDNLARIEGDVLDEMDGQKIVKAIGRGFNPEKAFSIIEKDYTFNHIDINRFADTENDKERLKGRVIGRDGETRKHIEKMTETYISVFGKTIGFIGHPQNIQVARETVKQLLNGSSHSSAYNYLEKNQDKIKR